MGTLNHTQFILHFSLYLHVLNLCELLLDLWDEFFLGTSQINSAGLCHLNQFISTQMESDITYREEQLNIPSFMIRKHILVRVVPLVS